MKTNQDIINELAAIVIEKTFQKENTKQYYIDPLTIILVISILLTLIRVIQECRQKRIKTMTEKDRYFYVHSEIQSLCFNNTLFTRMRIKAAIKQHLTKEQYNRYGKALLNSIIEVGSKVTDEQTVALLEYKHV
jgi:hypothetical protein